MILGVGTDMVDVTRIAAALEDHSQKFKHRVFTPAEQDYAEARPNPPQPMPNDSPPRRRLPRRWVSA